MVNLIKIGAINYVRINGVSGPAYGTAWNPRPVNEQTGVAKDVVLIWRPGDCAGDVNEHHVYFSADFDEVNQSTVPYETVNEPCYAPCILDLNTTYYW
ncbi:unnamed protein product, partial [marine sediment metagenome]